MPRINAKLTMYPSEIQVFVAYKDKAGIFVPYLSVIDTGAEVSLFPLSWLKTAEHKVLREIELEQAGLAKQAFSAIEAEITIHLEDLQGNISQEIRVKAWFAETDRSLLGFRDVLDRAKLYIDYQDTRTGWIDL